MCSSMCLVLLVGEVLCYMVLFGVVWRLCGVVVGGVVGGGRGGCCHLAGGEGRG